MNDNLILLGAWLTATGLVMLVYVLHTISIRERMPAYMKEQPRKPIYNIVNILELNRNRLIAEMEDRRCILFPNCTMCLNEESVIREFAYHIQNIAYYYRIGGFPC